MENGKTAPGDHWILIRCGLHHPYELKGFEPSANYALVAMRYVCVGEDSIFPVVSPQGKQRRRIAPTMHHRTFVNEIRRYHVETWYILQHRNPCTANTFLLKNMPRWRADTIRPYADGATESAGQKFSVQPAGIARPWLSLWESWHG